MVDRSVILFAPERRALRGDVGPGVPGGRPRAHSGSLHGWIAAAGAIVTLSILGSAFVAGGGAGAQESTGASALVAARAEHETTVAAAISAQQRLDDLAAEQTSLEAELAALGATDRDLVERMDQSSERARTYLVSAYILGTDMTIEDSILRQDSAGDLAYKTYLVREHGGSAKHAIRAFLDERRLLDNNLRGLQLRRDLNVSDRAQAKIDLQLALERVQLAELAVRVADHEAALQEGLLVVRSGDDGGPTPAESRNAFGPGWDNLRHCESGGNYAVVSPSGLYRGAYQFDLTTWRGVGGTGDPAKASPAEQDYRAQLLYNLRGDQPWPICGRYLREDPSLRPQPAVPPPTLPPSFEALTLPTLPVVPATTPPTTRPPPSSTPPTTTTTTTPPPTTPPSTVPSTTTTTVAP